MKFFNAFQLTLLFCAYPFLIDLCKNATFTGAQPLFYVLCCAYVAHFVFNVIACGELIEKM